MKHQVPKLPTQLIHWFCDDYWLDEVLGDLEEQFEDNLERHGRIRARMNYWYETLRFVRPHLIRKNQKYFSIMMTINHFKISYRNLIRNKVYSLINILGLAVGLASVLLIGLYVYYENSYDKFFDDEERIYRVALHRIYPGRTKDFGTSAMPLATVLKNDYPAVEEAARLHRLFFQNEVGVEIAENDKSFVERKMLFGDSSFFKVFSHPFIKGDPSTALNDENAIVVTQSTAVRYFGTDDVLSKTIEVNGNSRQITGVIADIPNNSHIHFDLMGSTSPLQFLRNADSTNNWTSPWVYTYIKLKDGASAEDLESQFEQMVDTYGGASLATTIGENWKENGHFFDYYLQPVTSIHLHSQLDVEVQPNSDIKYIYILSTIAIFILLISSINFVNLSMARSTERAKEVGIRKVLGSYRGTLISQFLAESIFVCSLASILAIGLLYFFIPVFNRLLTTYLEFSLVLNPVAISLYLGFMILTGILAGLYPALSISTMNPSRVLKGSYQSSSKGVWLRNGLITFQFLISIIMITASVIAEQQMHFLRNMNLGFNKENLLVVKHSFDLGENYRAFGNELEKIPEVTAYGSANLLPGEFHGSNVFKVNDPNIPDIRVNTSTVSDTYIEAMEFELVEGRLFSEEFNDSLSIILNEAAVMAMGVEKAVGLKYRVGNNPEAPEFNVVGVVKDYNFYSLHTEIGPLAIFNANQQQNLPSTVLRLNTNDLEASIRKVEETWNGLTEESFDYAFLDQELQRQYEADQNTTSMFEIFTYLANIMSCIGLFGLATYIMNQRSKEMSVRKVLGASLTHIISVFSKEFLILIGVAFIIGVPIAYFTLSEWLANFAFHIDIGPLSFLAAGIIILTLVIITVSYQALKVARINPVKILRSE